MKIVKLSNQDHDQSVEYAICHEDFPKLEITEGKRTSRLSPNGRSISYEVKNEVYKLKILSKGNEKKFFYALETLSPEEIKSLALEYWNDSETIGYVLD